MIALFLLGIAGGCDVASPPGDPVFEVEGRLTLPDGASPGLVRVVLTQGPSPWSERAGVVQVSELDASGHYRATVTGTRVVPWLVIDGEPQTTLALPGAPLPGSTSSPPITTIPPFDLRPVLRRIDIVVVDQRDQPISGAKCGFPSEVGVRRESVSTDSEGRAEYWTTLEHPEVTVAKKHRLLARRRIDRPTTEAEFVLGPGIPVTVEIPVVPRLPAGRVIVVSLAHTEDDLAKKGGYLPLPGDLKVVAEDGRCARFGAPYAGEYRVLVMLGEEETARQGFGGPRLHDDWLPVRVSADESAANRVEVSIPQERVDEALRAQAAARGRLRTAGETGR